MRALYQENKTAILFIVKFAGLYLILNSLYGFFISSYTPSADPLTVFITEQVAYLLSVFHTPVGTFTTGTVAHVDLVAAEGVVVSVFEGCNGINVMIVYVSFLFAFKGPLKSTGIFFGGGLVIIYLLNLLRVGLLFEVAYYYPQHLYFFHKYFFTAALYLAVFLLWFLWIKKVRSGEE